MLPTPPQLVNRALPTVDHLPPPSDGKYAATVAPVPADVLARSTWQKSCPVAASDLLRAVLEGSEPTWGPVRPGHYLRSLAEVVVPDEGAS